MEELVKQIAQRAGVSDEVAGKALEVVVATLKERLPGDLAGQVEGLLSGEAGAAGAGMLGNLAGKFLGR